VYVQKSTFPHVKIVFSVSLIIWIKDLSHLAFNKFSINPFHFLRWNKNSISIKLIIFELANIFITITKYLLAECVEFRCSVIATFNSFKV
jgi:hypothetical protein